jgi:hypothetical protein
LILIELESRAISLKIFSHQNVSVLIEIRVGHFEAVPVVKAKSLADWVPHHWKDKSRNIRKGSIIVPMSRIIACCIRATSIGEVIFKIFLSKVVIDWDHIQGINRKERRLGNGSLRLLLSYFKRGLILKSLLIKMSGLLAKVRREESKKLGITALDSP